MLYGIEGILNGKLFGSGEGGSSGGGITLPELTNPAGADQILEGYEAIDGSGNKLTGTHVCESGGGGVGVAPMIDHGGGYVTFSPSEDTTISAGGSNKVEVSTHDLANATPVNGCDAGYLYGHPEITACFDENNKYGWYLRKVWNSSATDFVFKAGETYTLVLLNPVG